MKVVIIGGVAGGASCATRLRRLDESAEIIVLERGENVSYANCGLPYFVGGKIEKEESLTVASPGFLRARFMIDVRVRSEAVGIDASAKTVRVRERDGSWCSRPARRRKPSAGRDGECSLSATYATRRGLRIMSARTA